MSINFPGSLDTDAILGVAVNSLATTLDGALAADTNGNNGSATEITVVSTTNFPTAGIFCVENEAIRYTGKSATKFTGITRGVDGTTAVAHLNGVAVELKIVAEHHNNLKDALIASEKIIQGLLHKNFLINGDFQVCQRIAEGTPFTSVTGTPNSDGTYLVDRWAILSDGNDIADVNQELTVVPAGSRAALKSEVETANKKFGFVQFIRSCDAKKLAGKNVSLSFQARTTAGKIINNIRAVILSWASTADVPTKDVVSAWNNQDVTPTWAANYTAENTPANLALTAAFQEFKIENIAIDTASMANVAVFIWVDDTDCSVDDLLYISQVQLTISETAIPWTGRSFDDEYRLCRTYYEKSFLYSVTPANINDTTYDNIPGLAAVSNTYASVVFQVAKRIAPAAMIFYTGVGGGAGTWQVFAGPADKSPSYVSGSERSGFVQVATGGSYPLIRGHWTVDVEIGA